MAAASRRLASALAIVALQACGGGGGGGNGGATPSPAPPPVNSAPVASAGEAATVDAGTVVVLDASASRDSDGSISSWAWQQTAGPAVTLDDSDSPQASFTAPSVTTDTALVFSVTVTDDDGASASASVTITVAALQALDPVRVAGIISTPPGQQLDGDTNDPNNPLRSNDDPENPQPIGNPITLGGYVNEPGAGPEGRSQISGDTEDFFTAELLAGQRINLLVGDFTESDADLYLYDETGALVDFSVETGEVEEINVTADGRYRINVSIFDGATNYTLTIGASPGAASRAARYRDVLPWDAIVSLDPATPNLSELQADLGRRWDARPVGGDARREQLLRLSARATGDTARHSRLGRQQSRRDRFADPALAARWETLMSIKHLRREPGVAMAEANLRRRPSATVNDPAYRYQWHYPLINLPGAWDTSVGNPEVVVAVVDTGILANHPDLRGQLLPGYDFIRDPGEAGDGDGIDPDPEETIGSADPAAVNYHGSHVTGTVVAAGNNGIGVAGVAFGARVMPLRALNASGGTSYDILQAVRYAAGLENDSGQLPAQPADIINLSLGGSGFSQTAQNLYSELRDRGIAVVAAAGNEGSTLPSYPAAYDTVIAVSAVDAEQNITRYSNRGDYIDVTAPGGDGSADINGDGYPDGVLSTGSADGDFAYTFLSGTSMAAPHVAGVFALMKSVNPDLDASDMERLLQDGRLSVDIGGAGRDDLFGHGLIDARRAIDAALAEAGGGLDTPPRLVSSTASLNFGTALSRLEFTLSNGGNGSVGAIAVIADQPWLSTEAVNVDESGLGRYRVTVSRDGLSPGIYEGLLLASSAAGNLNIRVLVSVADVSTTELGVIYVLVFDPQTDQVVAQTGLRGVNGAYRYEIPDVPPGRYQVFAGTDLDNDLLICDPGEACGAWLTIDDPLLIDADGDRSDVSFPIEYLIALPGSAATASGTASMPMPLLPRKENSR